MDPTDTAPQARHAPPISPQPVPGRVSLLGSLARQGQRAVVEKLVGRDKAPDESGDETIMHAPCL